jgi:predicted site-specific integrase-resolvase
MAREGKIRREQNMQGRTEWNEQDVLQLAGMDPEKRLTVVYARTEPIADVAGMRVESAEKRLEQQKQRVLEYCQKAGIPVDMVIGEVRRVNRVRNMIGDPPLGFSALMGLMAEKRVARLIVESRDRLVIGAPWEMFTWFVKVLTGTEVEVINKTVVTRESRIESKEWLMDAMLLYKVLCGEIKDKNVVEQFWGGPDIKLAKAAVKRLRKKERESVKTEWDSRELKKRRSKKIVDLDEVFE